MVIFPLVVDVSTDVSTFIHDSLLVGLPMVQIGKLQNLMNSAARLISGVKKFKHITPALMDLD